MWLIWNAKLLKWTVFFNAAPKPELISSTYKEGKHFQSAVLNVFVTCLKCGRGVIRSTRPAHSIWIIPLSDPTALEHTFYVQRHWWRFSAGMCPPSSSARHWAAQVSANVNKPHYTDRVLGCCHTHGVNTELPAKILLELLQLDRALNLTGSVTNGDFKRRRRVVAWLWVIYGERVC